MKLRALIVVVFSLLLTQVFAQQRPQYTQYIFNNYLLNPALSGMENYTDLRFGYRKQWAGINDAPQTTFVSANFNLGDQYLWRNPLSLPDKEESPMSRNYMQNYTASPSHHGVGVVAVLDDVGPLSRLDANLTYAYHLKVANAMNFSVGVAAGISRIGLDVNALQFDQQNDPAIRNTIISQIKPDLALGVWFYGANYFAGASIQQVLQQKLSFTNDPNYSLGKEVPHLFFTTGYRFFVAEDIAMTPSVMLKKVSPTPLSVDANLKVAFRDRLWVGGSYRRNDSFSALAGVNLNKLFNITYSYDFVTSELNTISSGSHEIVLGIQLNNIYQMLAPGRMW